MAFFFISVILGPPFLALLHIKRYINAALDGTLCRKKRYITFISAIYNSALKAL